MTRKTGAQLRQLAIDIEEGRVFTQRHIRRGDESLLFMIFMPLGFLGKFPKNLHDHLLYEYMEKALPTGINGYPIFMSFYHITPAQTQRLDAYLARYRAAKAKFQADSSDVR